MPVGRDSNLFSKCHHDIHATSRSNKYQAHKSTGVYYMKKKIVALGVLSALLVSSAVYAQNYWTGTGGKDMSLAFMEPIPHGLLTEDQTLPGLVKGYFYTNMVKYSDIRIPNREYRETLEQEAELNNKGSVRDIGETFGVDYVLTGDITRTSSTFTLNIQITRVEGAGVIAGHSGTYTKQQIIDKTAVNKATLDLLGQMRITLTALAREELGQAAAQQVIDTETSFADMMRSLRDRDSIAAPFYANQAAEIDPSLREMANRISIISTDIRTGNIGQDMRNDLQWGKEWEAQLVKTEQFFDTWFKTFNQPYTLIYTPEVQTGTIDTINRTDGTNWVSFTVELREMSNWTNPVLKTVNDVWRDLNATGRKTAWGFADWPRSRRSNVNPFTNGSKRLTIVVELLNEQQKVIGQQTFTEQGSWSFSFNQNVGIEKFDSWGEDAKTITFPAVKLADWTDKMTLRFTTVNNVPVADASKNGVLLITTRALYRDAAGFNYDGSGYGWDGFNKEGYDREGYARDGFNRDGYGRDGFNRAGYDKESYDRDGFNRAGGYDREGYDRDGFNRAGYDREGYGRDGILYDDAGYDRDGFNRAGYDSGGYGRDGFNKEGYDRDGYDKKGYNRDGYNRSGFARWSPVASYVSLLYTFRPGLPFGFTVGAPIILPGLYASFSFGPSDNIDEFVVGYTFNLLSHKKLWGLGLPLGIGGNDVEEQLVMEAGLQLRFSWFEIRGTYRTIGFRDSSFTISGGFCFWPGVNGQSRFEGF
jgi:hypothetical protein